MKKCFFKLVVVMLFFMVFMNLISADFLLGNKSYEIKDKYYINDEMSGWINLSLVDQNYSSMIYDNLGNGYTLKYLLERLKLTNYSCTPNDCMSNYVSKGIGLESEKISLVNNQDTIRGISVKGKSIEFKRAKLLVSSNSGSSCDPQLSIDIGNDNSSDWGNSKFINEHCGQELKSSCDVGYFPLGLVIAEQPYCENITLPKAPAFEIRAMIKRDDSGVSPGFYDGLLKAWVYNSKGELVGNCNLTKPTNSWGVSSCLVKYVSKENVGHYVCVSGREGSKLTGYLIQGKDASVFCGFMGDPAQTREFTKDYNIRAVAKKFDTIGSIRINDSTFNEQNLVTLSTYLNSYIANKYRGDCSKECVIPIKFSGINQEIVLGNISFEYLSDGGIISSNRLYNIGKSEVLVKSPFFIINLDSLNFSIPTREGNSTWQFYVGDKKAIEKEIKVSRESGLRISQIYPTDATVLTDVNFLAIIAMDINLSESGIYLNWDYGDGKMQRTDDVRSSHTYEAVGNYTISIKIINGSEEVSEYSTQIKINSARDLVGSILSDYKSKLSSIRSEISILPSEYQDKIKEKLKIDDIEAIIKDVEGSYGQLSTTVGTKDQEYTSLMNQLKSIDMPQLIKSDSKINSIFVNDVNNIDLDKLVTLFDDESYSEGQDSEYKWEIYKWSLENIQTMMNYESLSVYYKDRYETLLSKFSITFTPKTTIDYPVYLIINQDMENLVLGESYNVSEDLGYIGVLLDLSSTKTVSFATFEKISPYELPIFISPTLSVVNLDDEGGGGTINEASPRGLLVGLGIGVLLFFAITAYFFMQKWYKTNYEKSLFKDKNQLFNLMNFVSNAKRQNMPEKEIRKRLGYQKWKAEQVNYALKKFSKPNVHMKPGQTKPNAKKPLFSLFKKKSLPETKERRIAY
ncbi:MAG: hypothetical protein WC796_05585 [Candidatus Pacearchaeota archaeon]|jgi:PKD repeat protein